MKTIAIIQHIGNDGPSLFATWLDQQGLAYEVFKMHEGAQLPANIADHAGLCILGGPMSANDPLPYFPQLLEQVRECVAKDIPVIGHCLGGQLMARALGGTVQASENEEIGWSALEVIDPKAAAWFGPDTQVSLFQWHGESFSIPPGATQLLRGKYCANQAYLVRDMHLGMQFHCEVDEAKVREWMLAEASYVCTSTSPAVQQVETVFATLQADLAASQALASRIYTQWARNLKSTNPAADLPPLHAGCQSVK